MSLKKCPGGRLVADGKPCPGYLNPDGANFCAQCGEPLAGVALSDRVTPSFRRWARQYSVRWPGPSSAFFRDVARGPRSWRARLFRNFATADSVLMGQWYSNQPTGAMSKDLPIDAQRLRRQRRLVEPGERTLSASPNDYFDAHIPDRNESAYSVALCTSAAPIGMAPQMGHVDGGLFAANPSLDATQQFASLATAAILGGEGVQRINAVLPDEASLLDLGVGRALPLIAEAAEQVDLRPIVSWLSSFWMPAQV
jgi:hypothetical protein